MRRKQSFFYHLQVKESLYKLSCLYWQFYVFLARLLAKFDLFARTVNRKLDN